MAPIQAWNKLMRMNILSIDTSFFFFLFFTLGPAPFTPCPFWIFSYMWRSTHHFQIYLGTMVRPIMLQLALAIRWSGSNILVWHYDCTWEVNKRTAWHFWLNRLRWKQQALGEHMGVVRTQWMRISPIKWLHASKVDELCFSTPNLTLGGCWLARRLHSIINENSIQIGINIYTWATSGDVMYRIERDKPLLPLPCPL